jgi:hypothetical protein
LDAREANEAAYDAGEEIILMPEELIATVLSPYEQKKLTDGS